MICHDAKFALEGAWAYRDAMTFHFPKSVFGEVDLHWWDGLNDGVPYDREHVTKFGIPHKREWLNIPSIVLEVEKANGFEKEPFYKNGVLFRGTKGDLWFTHHGGYRFMPAHFREFYAAIREGREANDCFEYSVPLAKTVCLGNVSALAGRGTTLAWDGHRVTNDEKANAWVTKAYRKGWDPFA